MIGNKGRNDRWRQMGGYSARNRQWSGNDPHAPSPPLRRSPLWRFDRFGVNRDARQAGQRGAQHRLGTLGDLMRAL